MVQIHVCRLALTWLWISQITICCRDRSGLANQVRQNYNVWKAVWDPRGFPQNSSTLKKHLFCRYSLIQVDYCSRLVQMLWNENIFIARVKGDEDMVLWSSNLRFGVEESNVNLNGSGFFWSQSTEIIWFFSMFFVSENDYRARTAGCWNVSHCQQQQSYSGLPSPGRSNSTYLRNDIDDYFRRVGREKLCGNAVELLVFVDRVFATLETRGKLDRVNLRKDFWDCY